MSKSSADNPHIFVKTYRCIKQQLTTKGMVPSKSQDLLDGAILYSILQILWEIRSHLRRALIWGHHGKTNHHYHDTSPLNLCLLLSSGLAELLFSIRLPRLLSSTSFGKIKWVSWKNKIRLKQTLLRLRFSSIERFILSPLPYLFYHKIVFQSSLEKHRHY